MFGLNPIHFYVILGLICTNLFAGGMWWLNSVESDAYQTKLETCQEKHSAFVLKTKAAGDIAADKAKADKEFNERNADATIKGWAAALDVVRADNARKLRYTARTNSSGSGVSAPAATGQTTVGAGADPIPSPERVAADCAETTLTANFLQRYIEGLR